MIKIQVTQEDIAKGKKSDSSCCPVALACLKTLNKTWSNVFEQLSLIEDGGMEIFAKRRQLEDFIHKFDAGEKVEPFEFELPDEIA